MRDPNRTKHLDEQLHIGQGKGDQSLSFSMYQPSQISE
jgi:hypothetical protein